MAIKCGDCRYFVKAPLFYSHCEYRRRMRYSNDVVFANESACMDYESAEFCCKDCAYFKGEWCTQSNNSARNLQPACLRFFRRGDNGPNRSSDCFLTSACVDYLGKPDDCEELTILRTFRDTYLKSFAEGDMLVKEYYEIAPSIVEKINLSQHKEEYYSYIYFVITECISSIANGDNKAALDGYMAMVKQLMVQLL